LKLEEQIQTLLHRETVGIPWVLRMTTGEIASADEVSTAELIHGVAIQANALMEAVILLARELDARS
jgi:hypothetical protein